ncbi:hypothetical protein [Variovorax paradoxus]|jgi:hypothetical protein|uniref:hypothetical protein n=1 Tax=Variovorax paradoxus TaxID=34073 RepID=UPI0020A26161|nr:hypothetical protein [Variovorax paradoxus]
MHADCDVCKADGFQSQVRSSWLRNDEIALSESAWKLMGAADCDELVVRHSGAAGDCRRHARLEAFSRARGVVPLTRLRCR